jgi:hypothetical protein
MINFEFENDDDKLSIHMPKSKLELRDDSMMTAPSRPQDDELLLSRALANQNPQEIDLAYLQTLSAKFPIRPTKISR